MNKRLPRRSDEPARTIAVLALVAVEIRHHLRGRAPRACDDTPATLAARAEAAGFGALEPLPDHVEAALKLADETSPLAASAGTAAGCTPAAVQTPDFPPDFLFNVKQSPIISRKGCAEILQVSLDWFDRSASSLTAAYGFPAPRDATGQKRWDRAAVAAWSLTDIASQVLARARTAHAKASAKTEAAAS